MNIHPPLRGLEENTINNLVKIHLRVVNPQPDQRKFGTSHHLSLHEVLNIAHIIKLVNELSKILVLRIARKHGIINHGQGTIAEIKKFSSLGGTILKLTNSATASLIRPKVNIVGSGKTKKAINPQVYSLFLSSSIQERTYER
jgi:hypothetical protein